MKEKGQEGGMPRQIEAGDRQGGRELARQSEELARHMMHDYHLKGDTSLWESLLCEKTVWLGSGESMLFGGAAIRNHFREFVQYGTADILREEYHTLSQGGDMAVVYGKLITRMRSGESAGKRYRTMFSFCFGLVDGQIKLLMQHCTYEWQGTGLPLETIDAARKVTLGLANVPGMGSGETSSDGRGQSGGGAAVSAASSAVMSTRRAVTENGPAWRSPQLKAAAFLVAHNLSVVDSDAQRIPVHSDSQMLYIDPRTLMYAESRNHRTEVVTINKAFSCNITLGELTSLLPDYCCRVHRGYLINAHYIAAIRRSEVELASGVVIPIPTPKYAATKAHLTAIISGFKQAKDQGVSKTRQ